MECGINFRVRNILSSALLEDLPGRDARVAEYMVALDVDLNPNFVLEELKKYAGKKLDTSDDAPMALAIASSVSLSLRDAVDMRFWHWLSLHECPDLVRARWGSPPNINRVLGTAGRNAFARLWWGAQMTLPIDSEGSYTHKLFANQDVFEALVGRRIGRNPTAVKVVLDTLGGTPGGRSRVAIKNLNHLLSMTSLEALSETQLASELELLRDQAVA